MVDFVGWEMPVRYGSVIEEHRAVRTAAGLFDVSHMGELFVGGGGAETLVQRLTPNDVTKLAPGRAHYSGFLTEEGTYIDDLLVYRLAASEFLIVVNAANRAKDLAWLEEHASGDVVVEDRSDDYALLALQGPKAAEILARTTTLALDELRYYAFASSEVAGRPAIVSRTGYTGEDGFELYLAAGDGAAVWDRLLEEGAGDGLQPAGLGARDTLRLEASMALYGHEIDGTTTPWDAGLSWVVKMGKGDFVGRDALVAAREAGPCRRLVGLELTERGIARQGHEVVVDGEPVGVVTSGTWSPTFEKALAMAYVPPELAADGSELTISVRRRQIAARVVPLPFYKRPR